MQPTADQKDADAAKPIGETLSKTSSEPVSGKARVQPLTVARSSAIPAVLSSAPTALTMLAAFRRRWFTALGLSVVAGAIVGAALWFASPQTYTARTLILVAAMQPVVLGEASDTRVDFSSYKQTQMALAKSRKVLTKALADPKVKGLSVIQKEDDPLVWLEKQINVDYSVAPEILKISISGSEPDHLAPLVEAVRDAYLDEVVEKDYQSRFARLDKLREVQQQYMDKLKDKRDSLKKLMLPLGTGDPKLLRGQQEFEWKQLQMIEAELLQVEFQLLKASMPIPGQKEAAELKIPRSLINEFMMKDSEYARNAKSVAQLEQDVKTEYGRFHEPEKERPYQLKVAELNLAKEALANCRDEARERIMPLAREKYLFDMHGSKQLSKAEIEYLTNLHSTLREAVDKRTEKKQDVSKKTIDLEEFKEDIAAVDSVLKRLVAQSQNLEVEIQAEKRIRSMKDTAVLDEASKRWKVAGIGFTGAFCLVLFGVAYLEFRARRVNSPDELTEGLHLKLIGTMPVMSKRSTVSQKAQTLQTNRRMQSHFVESVDATRLMLVHTARLESLRVLLMTSAFGGEGKTMLSSHLAVNLATAGYRTLLIDADLRRPALHKVFHLPSNQGLSEVLRGEVDVAEAIRPGPVEGLSLLAAGDCKEQPTQLLTRGCLGTLLPMLRGQYDYILVDSAPLLPVADTQFIAQHVDGVILSVLRNVSRLPSVHAACERLAMLQIRILGAVVHGADVESSYYRGYGSDALQDQKI